MDTVRLSLEGAWNLLYTGLFLGAGLPILFALGVRFAAGGTSAVEGVTDGTTVASSAVSRVIAGICFAVVLLGVVTGIMIIVGAGMGKIVTFDHIYPTLIPKPH